MLGPEDLESMAGAGERGGLGTGVQLKNSHQEGLLTFIEAGLREAEQLAHTASTYKELEFETSSILGLPL